MLSLKKLTKNEELEHFIETSTQNRISPAPMSYLDHAAVYTVSRPETLADWIGGFVLNTSEHKRYLEVLSEDVRQRIERDFLPPEQTAEITCIWKSLSANVSPVEVTQLYFHALKEGYRSGKRYILAGTANEKIKKIQMIAFHRLVFEGEVDFYGESHRVWIYYCKREELLLGFVRYLLLYLRRLFKI